MARIQFPSNTNQSLFIDFLQNKGVSEYDDTGVDLIISDILLESSNEVVDIALSLGGSITSRRGFGN
ncbi:MAG: hypothetical protein KAH32_05695 [Chlamydiia bacterium]|nr:hypothetical protein [Chlamydiia bacterium]